jgi:phage-related protein
MAMTGRSCGCGGGAITTPPFTAPARVEAGCLLRRLQRGEFIAMPASRPMPDIGKRCHELRIRDARADWRIIYRLDDDAIVIADAFRKTTRTTPPSVIRNCAKRLAVYDATTGRGGSP